MYGEIAGLTGRFLAQLKEFVQHPSADGAIVLDEQSRALLRRLTPEQEELLVSVGAIIFQLHFNGPPGPSCGELTLRMAEEYLFVARGLIHAMPETAHLFLGVSAAEARQLASLTLDAARRAADEGRLKLVLRHDLVKLLGVFEKLGSVSLRRSYLLLNQRRVSS